MRLRLSGVLVWGAMCAPLAVMAQTVPIAQDAYFVSGSGTNFGTASGLNVGGSTNAQAVVQFDLSALPSGVTANQVAKATLSLFVNKNTAPGTINISVANGVWSELAISGLSGFPAAGAAIASGVAVPASNSYLTVDATAAVQSWLAQTTPNNGFLIASAGNGVNVLFDSKENATTSHPATLTILLTNYGPVGATGPTGQDGAVGPTGPAGPAGLNGINGLNGATGATGPAGAGSGTTHVSFRSVCQNTIGGSNFDSSSAVGAAATIQACDPATGNLDGYVGFANAATQHVQGHLYLPSTFADPITAVIAWNTTAVTGSVTFGLSAQCVAAGGIPSPGGFTTFASFPASAAQGTASRLSFTSPLTWNTGCGPNSLLYFDLRVSSADNSTGAPAQLKWLDLKVNQ